MPMHCTINSKLLTYFLSLFTFLTYSNTSKAGWSNLSTGINDQLTGVVFKGNNGLVSGYKGVYKTNTGGVGASSWTRYNITGNAADSLLYNRSRFNHAYSYNLNASNDVYVCGKDTTFNKAVVFRFNLATNAYSLVYYGMANSNLNKIGYSSYSSHYMAVGDSGLIVGFYDTTSFVIPNTFKNNLNCISFSGINVFIGSNDCWFRGTYDSFAKTIASVFKSSVGQTHKEFVPTGNYSFFSAGKALYYTNNLVEVNEYNNYDFGPLNANCMIGRGSSSKLFVGTDHGIFANSLNSSFVLEWFPTSLNYHINSIYSSSNSIYACGKNGVILVSTDDGGLTKPYAKLNLKGVCKGATLIINGAVGSSTSCSYYINSVYYSGTCNNNIYWGTSTPGVYNIDLYVSNGPGSYDTASQSINIVNQPLKNKPYTVNKRILCKTEPITIFIDSSETDVFYRLKNYADGINYGESQVGNGQRISFTSIPLTAGGKYYLEAISSLATCSSKFTDTITITIEKTKALFHTDKINVVEGEIVNFYQRCKDATFFKWEFYPNASIKVSNAPNPSLKYNSIDSNSVKLICWSANGCYDSIIAKGPKVYIEPNKPDSFFAIRTFSFDSIDGYYPCIGQTIQSKTGYFMQGKPLGDAIIHSYYGDSLPINKEQNAFIVKYNLNGVLKWKIHFNNDDYYKNNDFTKVIEDNLGNVYVSGGASLDSRLYDNKGDSITFIISGSSSTKRSFLIKLDSVGKLIWKLTSDKVYFYDIAIDKLGNILAHAGNGNDDAFIYLNDSSNYFINNLTNPTANTILLKINQFGNVLWHSRMNSAIVKKIAFSENNQIYVTGIYGTTMTLYSRGSTIANSFSGSSYNADKLFLAKYDSAGILLWKIRSITSASNDKVSPNDMVVDSFNNVYISGANSCYVSSIIQTFENTDLTTTTTNVGECFMAKINSNGKCLWIRGAANSYYGGFAQMIKVNNNEIAVIGFVADNNTSTLKTVTFNSTNNVNITKSFYITDHFICFYDSVGNLKRILETGVNANIPINTTSFLGFFKAQNNAYYISRTVGFYNNSGNLKYLGFPFSNQIPFSNLLIKFYENWRENYKSSNTQNTISRTQCDSFIAPSGRLITQTGTYGDIIPNIQGGDSIITIKLTLQKSESSYSFIACDSLLFRGTKYSVSGNYVQKTTNVLGCDSIINLNIEINKSKVDTISRIACDSFVFNSIVYRNTGVYKFNYKTTKQCDSVVFLNLKVNSKSLANYNIDFCDSIVLNNVTYKNSGTYNQKKINTSGCDSLITFNLNKRNSIANFKLVACDSIVINGIRYDSSGNFVQKKTNTFGCDSTINLDIQINKSKAAYLNFTACDSLQLNNNVYTQSGLYKLSHKTFTGCDSIVYANITINKTSFSNYTIPMCDSVILNGIVYKNAGNYEQKIMNSKGCDSIIHYTITNLKSAANYNLSFCDSIVLNTTIYKETGVYYQTVKNANNCDSVISYHLTKLNNGSSYNLEACNSLIINGFTYTERGTYYQTVKNVNACDSTITLHLTIHQTKADSIVMSACKYTSINGVLYDSSGIYYQTLTSTSGCDSILRIELTIVKINTVVNKVGNNLIAQENNASNYLWMNCSNNTTIPNLNSKVFAPVINGSYKVVLSKAQCVDTSLCYSINTIGLEEKIMSDLIKLYPNPNSGKFKVDVIDNAISYFNVVDMSGKVLHNVNNSNHDKIKSFELELNDGIYLINAMDKEGLTVARIKFIVVN